MRAYSWTNLMRKFYPNISLKLVCHNLFGFDLLMTFFIQTSGKEPLNEFIQFAKDFSEKSKIKDVNIFQNSAYFFNVKIIFDNGTLKTTLFTKPTIGKRFNKNAKVNFKIYDVTNWNTNNYTINILPDILKTWATFSMLKLSWKMEPLKRSLKQPSSLKLQTLIYI